MLPSIYQSVVLSLALQVALFVTAWPALAQTQASSKQDAPARVDRLLVVAPDAFHDVLEQYLVYKQTILPTELVSLQEVLRTSQGVDDPERLKTYLYSRWKSGELGYVLLVGDVDVMPVRYMVLDRKTAAAFDYAFYPSDLYYADLATADGKFDSWNAVQDSFHQQYFGEVRGEKNKKDNINFDGVDYRCEVAVGRWPVSNLDEVRLVAEKTMTYEKSLRAKQKPGLDRAALVVVAGWVDARQRLTGLFDRLQPAWTLQQRSLFGSAPGIPNSAAYGGGSRQTVERGRGVGGPCGAWNQRPFGKRASRCAASHKSPMPTACP